ncbi:MAG TPA: phosphopantetheine-binding protein [Herpetosiphonaceae bacterium]|nr:phosphopantetheine-binding protein [Herpetosiphonaceae bacterium]
MREAVVVVREDVPGEKRLVAYVVAAAGAELASGEVRAALQTKLPGYMVPAAVVVLEGLPLTANGKVDRRALPAPEGVRPAGAAGYVAPRDTVEQQLVALWETALGVQPIGVQDSFFELGGTSLAAVRLMAQIQQQWGQRLELAALFAGATIAEQAAQLRS